MFQILTLFLTSIFMTSVHSGGDIDYIKQKHEELKSYYEFNKKCTKNLEQVCKLRFLNSFNDKCLRENLDTFSKECQGIVKNSRIDQTFKSLIKEVKFEVDGIKEKHGRDLEDKTNNLNKSIEEKKE